MRPGQLDDLCSRLGVLNGEFGQGHVGIRLRWAYRLPTYVPTNLLDANEHGGTPSDVIAGLSCCIIRVFGRFRTSSNGRLVPVEGVEPSTY